MKAAVEGLRQMLREANDVVGRRRDEVNAAETYVAETRDQLSAACIRRAELAEALAHLERSSNAEPACPDGVS